MRLGVVNDKCQISKITVQLTLLAVVPPSIYSAPWSPGTPGSKLSTPKLSLTTGL